VISCKKAKKKNIWGTSQTYLNRSETRKSTSSRTPPAIFFSPNLFHITFIATTALAMRSLRYLEQSNAVYSFFGSRRLCHMCERHTAIRTCLPGLSHAVKRRGKSLTTLSIDCGRRTLHLTSVSQRILTANRARAMSYCDAFLSDVWYPRLAHITPRTVFIPMRKSEARAIKACAASAMSFRTSPRPALWASNTS
jgi:hypothetical protein